MLSAFLLGVALEDLFTLGVGFVATVFGVTLLLCVLVYFSAAHQRYAHVVLVLVMLALGVVRGLLVSDLAAFPPGTERATIEGVVTEEPDVRELYTALTVDIDHVAGNVATHPPRILVLAPRYPEYTYGDRISAQGRIAIPEDFATDESGRVFHYRMYLAKDEIGAIMRYPKITRIADGEGNVLRAKLIHMKERFLSSLATIVPEPENALLGGLLLGGKRSLGEDLVNDMRIAGIVHIVVLSGYNMTVVAQWVTTIFRPLGFFASATCGALAIVAFAIMAGAGATVVRAALMALIVIIARVTGKTYAMGRALLCAAFLMVLHDPLILLYDPSFQLSFLASLGLVFVTPILGSTIKFLRTVPFIREIVLTTIATQIAVLPLLLFQNGMLSVYALPANLLVLPLIPAAMFGGFLAGIAGLVNITAGVVVAIPSVAVLSWIVGVGTFIADLPGASMILPQFPIVALLLCYLLYALVIVHFMRKGLYLRPGVHQVSPENSDNDKRVKR